MNGPKTLSLVIPCYNEVRSPNHTPANTAENQRFPPGLTLDGCGCTGVC